MLKRFTCFIRKNTQNSRKTPQNSKKKHSKLKENPSKLKELNFFAFLESWSCDVKKMSQKDPGCFYTLSNPFQHFHIHSYTLLYAFIRFHTLLYPFQHCNIHFSMLLCAFHTLSYAFKRKKAKRPLDPLNYTIVRLSRCAAGKN